MMGLTQENVHYTRRYEPVEQGSCADPGIFVRGGGVQKTVWTMIFFSHQIILQFTEWIQWFYYRGEEGVQLLPGGGGGGGGSKETHITCDFPGGEGPDPLTPLWIRTWGRLTPLFAYRLKNTIQRRLNGKKLSPAGRDSKCGSREGSGGPDPPGKSQVIWVSIGYKQLDPPGKSWTPPPPPGKCWTPSGTLKNDSFLRN